MSKGGAKAPLLLNTNKMAHATEKKKKVAPSKNEGAVIDEMSKEDAILEELGIELDPSIKYMFQLVEENPERDLPVWDMRTNRPAEKKRFKPYQNIVLSSQIVFNKSRTNIRYYDGCDTIFVSDQPKEKETIDQLIQNTTRRHFEDGYFGAYGDDRMLVIYLLACSWNAESPFRTRTANAIFMPVDQMKKAEAKLSLIDQIELSLKYAREASDLKMLIHANYLGIPTVDYVSGNELTTKEIRASYREEASKNPKQFIESYTDKSIEMRYYIDNALAKGTIQFNVIPNKATWKSGSIITDISGLKSAEGVATKLMELSQLEEGEDFVLQLKALYS